MTMKNYFKFCGALALLPLVVVLVAGAGFSLLGCEGSGAVGVTACSRGSLDVGRAFGKVMLTAAFGGGLLVLLAGLLIVGGLVYQHKYRPSRDAL